ncbi:MAG: prepilin-type N-terminal cleavage/methylation domain-containing protein [Deltaproteobacteria bacterium]|nr:MAG: prepilin-type N-terminal cleavage/methylation domain-containing protein [Deltaproteobacteria bacterium]
MKAQRGFTLLEVLVALAIMGISLTVLLQAQGAALRSASRSRDMTVATLLARGKMIDIEKHLFHDGFSLSTEDESGDFSAEGASEMKWHYRISEVEFDMSALLSLCDKFAPGSAKGGDSSARSDCESFLGGLGASIGGFTEELGRSLRAVELTVSWAEGKFTQKMSLRAMLSRDDFQTEQDSEVQKLNTELKQGAAPGGQPLGTSAPSSAAGPGSLP